jgi:hypothetical protein
MKDFSQYLFILMLQINTEAAVQSVTAHQTQAQYLFMFQLFLSFSIRNIQPQRFWQ